MKILKIIILQSLWYIYVAYGFNYEYLVFSSALLIVFLNFKFYRPTISKGHYIFCLIIFSISGFIIENSMIYLGLVKQPTSISILWLNSLYIIFLCWYGDIFNYLCKLKIPLLFIMGAAGGALAYTGGVKLSPLVAQGMNYYLAIAFAWGLFFPFSIKVFYEGFMWNKLLDLSIIYSFDKSGFQRHKKEFKDSSLNFMKGKNALVTGGTSGIGKEVAKELAKNDVNVTITGRNQERGKDIEEAFKNISFVKFDMIDWNMIEDVANSQVQLDYIVLNAGGMPDKFLKNDKGVESQFASQLFGHYYLIKSLKAKGKINRGARIVWVTSGGMYLRDLDLNTIFEDEKYDKVATYANVKRAQVTALPYFKEQFPDQKVMAMHPGWAETPGVKSAIPKFDEKMKGKLRSPAQGADTILWLLSNECTPVSGELYFDRRVVKKHFFWFTKKSDKKASQLIEHLQSLT